ETGSRDSGTFLRELFRRGASLDPLTRLGYVDMASFLSGNCLEYADRMAMANSMELRCPFADHRIQEFGLSIPFAWKCRHGKTKWVPGGGREGFFSGLFPAGKEDGIHPAGAAMGQPRVAPADFGPVVRPGSRSSWNLPAGRGCSSAQRPF